METNINSWLEEKGFEQYTKLFKENGITIDELPNITTHNELKAIGIKSFVNRKKLLAEITTLSAKPPQGSTPPNTPGSTPNSKQATSSSSRKGTTKKIERIKPSTNRRNNESEEAKINKRELKKKVELLGKDNEDVAASYYDLGMNYYMNDQYDEAIANHKKSLEIRIKLTGKNDDKVAGLYHQIGSDYYYDKNYKQALINYKKSLEIMINFYEEEEESIGQIYYDMAWCYYQDEIYDKSIALLKNALKIRISAFGEDHEGVAHCYYSLGNGYLSDKQYNKSIDNYKKALKIRISLTGEKNEDVALSYYQLGHTYYMDDQNIQAIANHKKALAIRISLTGAMHEDVADCYFHLGMDYYFENRYKEAIANHKKAIEIKIKLSGAVNKDVADYYAQLGQDYRFNDQFEQGIFYQKKALEIRTKLYGEEHKEVIELKKTVADYYNEPKETSDNDNNEIHRSSPKKNYRVHEYNNVTSNLHFFMKFTGSLILSLVTVVLFILFFSFQIFNPPEFEYDSEWFTTAKSGYLTWNSSDKEDDTQTFKKKTSLTPGIQLKPIAKQNDYWIQAETPRGQRGFVHYTLLTGASYVEAEDNVIVFNKIGDNTGDTIATGTKASIINRSTVNNNNNSESNFIKIKFEDGRIRWANDDGFKKLIFNEIPSINKKYYYPTTFDIAEQNIISSSLAEIELHYGISTSYIKGIGKNQAYFGNLTVVDKKNHYRGIMVNLTKQDTATGFMYTGEPLTRSYDYLPFINIIRKLETSSLHKSVSSTIEFIKDKKLEPSRLFGFLFYHHSGDNSNWWTRFINNNWFTMTIGWIINAIMFIIVLAIIFSIPRLIVAPIMQLVERIPNLRVRHIKIINYMIFLIATYFFLLIMIIIMDQFFMPALASSLVFIVRWRMYRNKFNVSDNNIVY